MDETHNKTETSVNPEPVHQEVEIPVKKNSNSPVIYIAAVIVIVAILAAVALYLNNQNDNAADSNGITPNEVVVTVNGVDILGSDLSTSIGQITTTAQLQGIDTTDPAVQYEIKNQAVEMLINTELLTQEASDRGIVVTDAEVEARIEALIAEIGSEEALNERMESLGIDQETLERDIQSELMIQELLDQVFAEKEITVTDEEVESLYEGTTGGSETAPALEDVRAQIEAQIRASKEQAAVDEFISSLRTDAEVEVTE